VFYILSHPFTLIFSFLFILITGEHLGGFYALYLFLGLPAGVVHSLLGFAGMIVLVVSHYLPVDTKVIIRQCLNLIGAGLLFASVFLFFFNDKQRYNWGTFEESVPLITLVLSCLIAFCFVVNTFIHPIPKRGLIKEFLSKV